jgi:hypothetical protein
MAANRSGIKVAWIKDMVDLRLRDDITMDLTFDSANELLNWLIAHE